MSLVNLPGGLSFIGPQLWPLNNSWVMTATTLDATNESLVFIGQVFTSDGGSHTIDSTGASALGWRSGTLTFASGSTTVRVGIAAVDAAAGPPARALHVSNVITFDVYRDIIGGTGGIAGSAFQSHVPTNGSKTIAHGDFVAFAIQMRARGGSDAINVEGLTTSGAYTHGTSWLGSSYAVTAALPNCFITFSDGAFGWLYGSVICSVPSSRSYNNTSGTKEYGQLYQLPFPVRVYGAYAQLAQAGDYNIVLYGDPLGTPTTLASTSHDANVVGASTRRRTMSLFATPYEVPANTPVGIVVVPTSASNVTLDYKTITSTNHNLVDPWGSTGYGISRNTGSFSNDNSSLNHYMVGLLAGGFEVGGSAGRSIPVNNPSLVG